MRVGENHFARRGAIGEIDDTSARCEALAIVAGVVVHALYGAAVGAHQPLGALERVLAAEFQPLGIVGFFRRPPPDLQVHHGVHNGVVAVDVPGGDQIGQRVV